MAEAAIGAVVGAITSFTTTLVTGGSLKDAAIDALIGAATGALCAAFPEICTAVAAYDALRTAWGVWISGGSFWAGLGCGAVAFGTSFVSGNTNSRLANTLVDLTFGLGASTSSAAISVAVEKNAKESRSKKSYYIPSPEDFAYREFNPYPAMYGTGSGGNRYISRF